MSAIDVGAVEAPRFGGAKHASDHDNRSRYREVGLSGRRTDILTEGLCHREQSGRDQARSTAKMSPRIDTPSRATRPRAREIIEEFALN